MGWGLVVGVTILPSKLLGGIDGVRVQVLVLVL